MHYLCKILPPAQLNVTAKYLVLLAGEDEQTFRFILTLLVCHRFSPVLKDGKESPIGQKHCAKKRIIGAQKCYGRLNVEWSLMATIFSFFAVVWSKF